MLSKVRIVALDINGTDSAHKLAILALIAFKFSASFKDIYVEGIGDIESSDIELFFSRQRQLPGDDFGSAHYLANPRRVQLVDESLNQLFAGSR